MIPRLLKLLDPRADGLSDGGLHLLPVHRGAVAVRRAGLAHSTDVRRGACANGLAGPADQEDGAVGRRLVLDVQAALGLCVHRPRRGDDEAGFDEPRGQRVPGAGRLVREHQRHHAVGFQDPPALGKDACHALLVVAPGQRLRAGCPAKRAGIRDRLVLLVGQLPAEQLGERRDPRSA